MAGGDKEMTIDQFTRQAQGYARSTTIRNDDVLKRFVALAKLSANDTTLDVACGPGLVVCAFAPHVRHATGIDITPAMLEQARQLQAEKGLRNVSWIEGDVSRLPFADGEFSVVTSRYAFHHFADPRAVLREMIRVMKPGGAIVIADSAPAATKAEAFNRMEKLRDPSHGRALSIEKWEQLLAEAGLTLSHFEQFRLAGDLDSLLARSFPADGGEARVRQMFEAALEEDFLDVQPRRESGGIVYGFPIVIFKARRPPAKTQGYETACHSSSEGSTPRTSLPMLPKSNAVCIFPIDVPVRTVKGVPRQNFAGRFSLEPGASGIGGYQPFRVG
jgi:ubiquinone/menaquinone biosynthesis C-methylase UbiE